MAGKFEVYEDKGGQYRFRLKAGNGQVVATTPYDGGYDTTAAAKKGCEAVQEAARDAVIVEV